MVLMLAHKKSLENDLDTVGVVAHGLDRIYPTAHEKHCYENAKERRNTY